MRWKKKKLKLMDRTYTELRLYTSHLIKYDHKKKRFCSTARPPHYKMHPPRTDVNKVSPIRDLLSKPYQSTEFVTELARLKQVNFKFKKKIDIHQLRLDLVFLKGNVSLKL